jgi:hypothetical protein
MFNLHRSPDDALNTWARPTSAKATCALTLTTHINRWQVHCEHELFPQHPRLQSQLHLALHAHPLGQ